ncbi:MAG: cytochrome-c oxidase, cbb3-type subunit II, partial [Pirellulaceae bacterium]|nr:cytochrome-c oxidase, cbb3-type subunit II [Pirellulaceae bacterium]
EFGKKLDVWSRMDWHRRWEHLPMLFTVWVVVAVVVASLLEIVPTFLIRANVPTIAKVTPYTPLELAGRDLYVAEGCYGCHSQMIRPILAEIKRYGEYSKPGEFVYDHPFQWGSRRVGPDLAREGGRQSHLWHYQHMERPQQTSPGSTMPNYVHLLTTKLNFNAIPERVKAAMLLGAKYNFEASEAGDKARIQAAEIAQELERQNGPKGKGDMQIIAMIAYLQRLGTDISKPDPAPADSPSPKTPDAKVVAEKISVNGGAQ